MCRPVWTSRTSTQTAIDQASRYACCLLLSRSFTTCLLATHACILSKPHFPHYHQDAHGTASLLVSTSFPNLTLVLQDRTLLQDAPNMLVLVLLYMMQGVPLGLTMGAMYAFRIATFLNFPVATVYRSNNGRLLHPQYRLQSCPMPIQDRSRQTSCVQSSLQL